MKRIASSLVAIWVSASLSTASAQAGADRAGTQPRTQETSSQAQQKAEKTSEPSTKPGQVLTAQMFKRGVPFCITGAVIDPPNKLELTVQFNPNIPADKAIKGMLRVKEYPTGSGMFVEVTYSRTVISPSPDPQTLSQEIAGLATGDGAVLIVQVIGLFTGNVSANAAGGINVSNRVKLERVSGKWTTVTLDMDSN